MLACRRRLPEQAAAISISYLGIGSISMAQLHMLPPAAVLRKWLKHTSRAMDAAAKHPGQVSRSEEGWAHTSIIGALPAWAAAHG